VIFIDKDTRALFAKTAPILQIIVSDVEFELAKQSLQVELIDVFEEAAVLAIEGGNELILQQLCSDMNKKYQRFDDEFTCVSPEEEILIVKCNSPAELANVH